MLMWSTHSNVPLHCHCQRLDHDDDNDADDDNDDDNLDDDWDDDDDKYGQGLDCHCRRHRQCHHHQQHQCHHYFRCHQYEEV